MEFISDKLIKLIERDAHQLTKNWLNNVQNHSTTPTYHTYDQNKLYERAFRVYSQLGKWISRETPHKKITRSAERMNKLELIQALKDATDLSRSKAATVVDIFFNEMAEELAKGWRVEIRG